MLVLGDAGERGARLALAAGAERHHLVGRQIPVSVDAAEVLHAIEITGLAGDLRDALHGAADHDHLALGGARGLRHGAHARDMRRERGHRHAGGRRPDQLGERFRHVRLRGRAALAHRIGGIADQREATLGAQRAQFRFVGRRSENRGGIDLPVTGVQDRPRAACG